MLETIREYAAERLEAVGEADELRRQHLEHYAALADASYDETWSGRGDFARIIEERENLRAALEFALETDSEAALVLARILSVYWLSHGGLREGREKLADGLARQVDSFLKKTGYVAHVRRIGEEKLDAAGRKRFPARRWVVERTLAWLQRCWALLIRFPPAPVRRTLRWTS
jgi:hypothetical protein